jgi:hypothetical protein
VEAERGPRTCVCACVRACVRVCVGGGTVVCCCVQAEAWVHWLGSPQSGQGATSARQPRQTTQHTARLSGQQGAPAKKTPPTPWMSGSLACAA